MKKILFILIILLYSVVNHALGDYDYVQNKINECKPEEWGLDNLTWLNANEFEYRGVYGDTKCGCVSGCEMGAWFNLYHEYNLDYSDNELDQIITSHQEQFNYVKSMPKTCCNETVNVWASMAHSQGEMAKFNDLRGNHITAAEGYYRQAQYLEDTCANGFEDVSTGNTLMAAANSYRMAGKQYCKINQDQEAHGMFNNARQIYISEGFGQDHIDGLINDEECGQYAKTESCMSFIMLLGMIGVSQIF